MDGYDIVVIGAGLAGSVAARVAQQRGANAVLLERTTGGAGGNTRLSSGWFHAAYLDPRRPPAELYDAIMTSSEGHTRPEVARAWSENVGRAFDFLVAEGGEFAPFAGPAVPEFRRNEIQPQPIGSRKERAHPDEWKGRGPDRLLNKMHAAFVERGGTLLRGFRAAKLVMEDGEIAGVEVANSDGTRGRIYGSTVIMADGGFQADRDLVHKYITGAYYLICSKEDTGDCLKMATAIGAQTANMDAFYGHLRTRDLNGDDSRTAIYHSPAQITDVAIVVDGHGRRIGDEFRGTKWYSPIDDPIAGYIAKCDTPGNTWVVFDHSTWETVGRMGVDPINPGLLEDGGPLMTADSIAELARLIDVAAPNLAATVEDFNRFVRDGGTIDPPRTGSPQIVAQPPFHAIPLIAGITFVMGGLLVNDNAQVLDTSNRPIPWLYAVGQTMGGLQGGPHNGYTGGWSEASTFGMLAGEHAAAVARARQIVTATAT
jgi:fumarate reductase flavoprotein subunit